MIELSAIGAEFLAAGRNGGPDVLVNWWLSGRLDREELRRHITAVWQLAEWPAALGIRTWVTMFREAGFISDTDEPVPDYPLTVYRGTTWGRRRGMSWTTDIDRARWFAARWQLRGERGEVFTAIVPPAAVLALVGDPENHNEEEVVVDPAMLPPLGLSALIV